MPSDDIKMPEVPAGWFWEVRMTADSWQKFEVQLRRKTWGGLFSKVVHSANCQTLDRIISTAETIKSMTDELNGNADVTGRYHT